jgi:hypothetical protein
VLIDHVHDVTIPILIRSRTHERSRDERGQSVHRVTIRADVDGDWLIEGTNVAIPDGADFEYTFRWTN